MGIHYDYQKIIRVLIMDKQLYKFSAIISLICAVLVGPVLFFAFSSTLESLVNPNASSAILLKMVTLVFGVAQASLIWVLNKCLINSYNEIEMEMPTLFLLCTIVIYTLLGLTEFQSHVSGWWTVVPIMVYGGVLVYYGVSLLMTDIASLKFFAIASIISGVLYASMILVFLAPLADIAGLLALSIFFFKQAKRDADYMIEIEN